MNKVTKVLLWIIAVLLIWIAVMCLVIWYNMDEKSSVQNSQTVPETTSATEDIIAMPSITDGPTEGEEQMTNDATEEPFVSETVKETELPTEYSATEPEATEKSNETDGSDHTTWPEATKPIESEGDKDDMTQTTETDRESEGEDRPDQSTPTEGVPEEDAPDVQQGGADANLGDEGAGEEL